jgi:multicomponent Na+:H+ antiporter subunit E
LSEIRASRLFWRHIGMLIARATWVTVAVIDMGAQSMALPMCRQTWRGFRSLWVILFAIWAAANSTLDPPVLALGLFLTGVIAFVATAATGLWNDIRLTPRAGVEFCRYTFIFLREVVQSNLNVLRYVYAPHVTVRPGIVPTRTGLKSPLGRFMLANAVSLTPGTLVMDLAGDTLSVHMLDQTTTDVDANTRIASGAFEPTLARSLG